ncbi:MAG: hypothetical protein DHS20C02_20610 [Micavibrio sp.]|nr:MAG: hypothetical protein DHS20C02_20610 [Micavibrio sp.]
MKLLKIAERKPTWRNHGFEVSSFHNPLLALDVIQSHINTISNAKGDHENVLSTQLFLAFRMANQIDIDDIEVLCDKLADAAAPHLDSAAIYLIIDDACSRANEDGDQTRQQELDERLDMVKQPGRKDRTQTLIHQLYAAYHLADERTIHKHHIEKVFFDAAREAGIGELTTRLAIKKVCDRHQRQLKAAVY